MKKLIVLLFVLFTSLSVSAQDIIYLKNEKVIKCKIDSLNSDFTTLYFTSKKYSEKKINISDVSSYIWDGETNKGYLKNIDMSDVINPIYGKSIKCKIDTVNNVYISFYIKNKFYKISLSDINSYIRNNKETKMIDKIKTLDYINNKELETAINSSYYLKKASTNIVTGFSLGIVGSLITATSSSLIPVSIENGKDKNEDSRKILTYMGVGLGIVGIIEVIIGSSQIGQAGVCLDQERKIFLSPSKSGVGVNINF